MGANNQGIMHLAATMGGRPVCRNRRAHMSTTADRFEHDSKQCKKCAAVFAKWQAKKGKKLEQQTPNCSPASQG